MLGLAAALHGAGLYWLAQALIPEMAQSLPREVITAFQIEASQIEAPPPPTAPPQPENRPEPDEGARGEPGEEATPAAATAPPARLPVPDPTPRPRAAATGTAPTSGAREAGEGTGAAGAGMGTGSGNRGSGAGGVGVGGAVTKPRHISGAIDNARDYPTPPGGRTSRRGTEVIVRVIVTRQGRARDCSIYRPSPDPQADRITCQLVVERLGFEPARDAAGNPVEAPFYWRQRWF